MSPENRLVTTRYDRKTKLAILAATIVASASDPRNPEEIREAVDGAFLIEAEIEDRMRGQR